jgi:hypothetical protein
MLDDLGVLRSAVAGYRAAATAFGIPWPDDRTPTLPAAELRRIFDVGDLPEQLLWLHSQALPPDRVLPAGTHVLPWTDGGELLDFLSMSVAVPFAWRRQVPLFFIDHLVFTFVLANGYEGEIWRYQIDPEDWNPVRAAPSLATQFIQWTNGFAAGVYRRQPYDEWLHLDEELLEATPGLDPFAFPMYMSVYDHRELIRSRQRECGVDVERAESFEALEELADAIAAVRRTLAEP